MEYNLIISFHNVVILISSVGKKDKNNFYYNILLEKLYMNYLKNNFCMKHKCYIMIELTFLKKLVLTKQVYEKSMIFVTIGIF